MNIGPESETVEHKKSTSELKEGVSSIASILNKHGHGELYFGVKNNGDVVGQQVADTTLREISQAIGSSIEPRIVPEISVLDDGEGHDYIRVAFEGKSKPYACKNSYRIRSADEDVPMTNEQVRQMFQDAFFEENPWDEQPSARPMSDVNEKVLRDFVERGIKAKRITEPYSDVRSTLASLKLLKDGALTNAAAVLFCESPHTALKMGILESHSRTEILDLHQESGTVFELVDKAETYILNNTRRRFVIDDIGPRKEVPELPLAAVREGLINAYVHRDWTRNASVQVDIFYDSVEIYSPGWFIEGQSPEAHLYEGDTSSDTRNKLIADTVFRSGDMEAYGTGIGRIRDLCDEVGIRVEYVRVPSGTKLIFHRNDAFEKPAEDSRRLPKIAEDCRSGDEIWLSLSEKEQQIVLYLMDYGPAKTKALSQALEISERTLRYNLNRLVDREIVKAQGATSSRTYSVSPDILARWVKTIS